jgi:hypothetical protein
MEQIKQTLWLDVVFYIVILVISFDFSEFV